MKLTWRIVAEAVVIALVVQLVIHELEQYSTTVSTIFGVSPSTGATPKTTQQGYAVGNPAIYGPG